MKHKSFYIKKKLKIHFVGFKSLQKGNISCKLLLFLQPFWWTVMLQFLSKDEVNSSNVFAHIRKEWKEK